MQIVAAVFIDDIEMRQVPGPTTRIDLRGVQFSAPAPQPPPFTWAPHLVVLIRCAPGEPGEGALEVVFRIGDEQVARNVQPLQVEPGKFTYRLVRAEVEVDAIGTIEAHCRLSGDEHVIVVPYTVLPPLEAGA